MTTVSIMYEGGTEIYTKRDKLREGVAGFTLVELLIVIAILGLIATLAIPKVKDILDNAKGRITETNAITVQNAIDMYYAENQEFPNASDINALEDKLKDYIKEIPEDVKDNYTYDKSKGILDRGKK